MSLRKRIVNVGAKEDLERTIRERFEDFADVLPCFVWIADALGQIEWSNAEFRTYVGLSLGPHEDAGWMEIVHPDDRRALADNWARALASGATLDCNARLRGDGLSYRWFAVRARPFRGSDGTIVRWFGTLDDIHEREDAVEAKAHMLDALMEGLLAKPFPVVAGLSFDAIYRAANVFDTIGGDWYDVFTLPDGRIGFSIGDVCGHGIDAAVKMGEARQAIFAAASLGDPAPEAVLSQANRVLFLGRHDVSMTTALYGVVDLVRHTVTYACAGHHPPILARSDRPAETLPNHGFPLGVEEHVLARLKTHEFAYEVGSTMVMYTDGLIEVDRDLFGGEKRLLLACDEAVASGAEFPAKCIATRVLANATPIDDVAVLTITFDARR